MSRTLHSTSKALLTFFMLVFAGLGTVSRAAPIDVSNQISVTLSGLVLNRTTNTFDSVATLTNVSANTISAPISLVIATVSPASITPANASGTTTDGKPFVAVSVPTGSLTPGAKVSSILLKFNNASRVPFNITTQVLGESGTSIMPPQVVADPMDFLTNTSTKVRFQAQILPTSPLDPNGVMLFRADQNQNPIGSALCTLQDNGQLASGDDIAGDNVFSCFATFQEALPTKISLVVVAKSGVTSVASSIILLNVVAPLTNAQAQAIVDAQAQAEQIWANFLAQLGDTLAARLEAVKAIKQIPVVADAGVSSDLVTIWIDYTSGVSGGLMLNPSGTRGGTALQKIASGRASQTSQPSQAISVAPASFPSPSKKTIQASTSNKLSIASAAAIVAENTLIGNTNVLVWDAYNSQFAPDDEGPDLKTLFEGSQCPKFNVTYLIDGQATVNSVRTFSQYGTIILVTHGAVDGKGQVVFLTREPANVLSIIGHSIDLLLGRISTLSGVFAIRPSFISSLSGSFANSNVYNGSCQSSANATMSNAFFGKGAKTYYGFTRIVNSNFAKSSANQLFGNLVTALKNTGDSFSPVSPKVDPTTPFATFTQSGDTMLAYSGDLQNGNFEKGNLTSWTPAGDARVLTALGPFSPTDGTYAGLISTGLGFTISSGSIQQNMCLAKTATKLKFDWNFSSEEFTEWCNHQFDDTLEVSLITDSATNVLFTRSINGLCATAISQTSLFFDQSGLGCTPSAGVGFGTGGNDCKVWSTGWKSEQIDISGIANANNGKGVTLRFRTFDVGDSIFDSAILLDKIEIVKP